MSIGNRFMVLVALSLTLAVSGVFVVIVDREQNALMTAAESQGYALAEALAVTFLAHYLREEDDMVREIGTQVVDGGGVGNTAAPAYLVVVDPTGRPLFARGNEKLPPEHDAILSRNAVATSGNQQTDVVRLKDGTLALDLKARMAIRQVGGEIRRFGAVRLGVSLVELRREMTRTYRTVFLLACSVLVVGLVATWFMTRRLIGSIEYLGTRIRGIVAGNLSPETRLDRRDELAVLERSINRLAEDLQKRELLKQYISTTTWEEIERSVVQGGRGITQEWESGQLKKVTILFMDIRNFTALAESSHSREVVELLNEIFGMMVDIIETYGGVLDKFIGDALLTVFYPEDDDADSIRAVYCAVEMQLRLEQFNQRRAFYGRDGVRAGIGINSGQVIAGSIGARTRKDHTVIGDPVNVAARLEKISKEGSHTHIVVSEETYRGIEGLVQAVPVQGAQIRGRQKNLDVYEIVSVKDVDEIISLLTSADSAFRDHAFRAVGARGGEQAVPVLVDLLQEKDQEIVQRSIVVLGRLGRTEERIGEVLKTIIETTGNKRIMATAIKAAAIQSGRLDPKLLRKLLSDDDPRVRANTVEALDHLGGHDYLDWIGPLIYDSNARVRANASIVSWKYGRQDVTSILECLAAAESSEERRSAVFAAGELFSVAERPPPRDYSSDTTVELLARELAEYRKLRDIVRKALDDESPDVRRQAIRAVHRTRDPAALEGLLKNMDSCDSIERESIFQAMVSIGLPAPIMRIIDSEMGRAHGAFS